SLPQMNADDADQPELEEEFVPLPGEAGYRFTRFRLNVQPETNAGSRPPQSEMERDDIAQSHANLG
ncbi:MAG TPA: hypothetical protein VFR84_11460, partial [Candidatus Angelobacter sp.]|nr:hypothetical protein [Candidatus Angelobacter sp.]